MGDSVSEGRPRVPFPSVFAFIRGVEPSRVSFYPIGPSNAARCVVLLVRRCSFRQPRSAGNKQVLVASLFFPNTPAALSSFRNSGIRQVSLCSQPVSSVLSGTFFGGPLQSPRGAATKHSRRWMNPSPRMRPIPSDFLSLDASLLFPSLKFLFRSHLTTRATPLR